MKQTSTNGLFSISQKPSKSLYGSPIISGVEVILYDEIRLIVW